MLKNNNILFENYLSNVTKAKLPSWP